LAVFTTAEKGGMMKGTDKEHVKNETERDAVKKPYERAAIQEHEPLEEAVAGTYYYYEYSSPFF
jgi:hypothetical protein